MKIITKSNNESGFTLVGVLAVFTIISVFGISLVMLSISSVKTSNTEHNDQSVFYIAEAGANYMVNEIEREVKHIYSDFNVTTEEEFFVKLDADLQIGEKIYDEFEPIKNKIPEASIVTEKLNGAEDRTYKITSTGNIGGQKRTVERTVSIQWPGREDDGGSGNVDGGSGLLPPFAVYILKGMLKIDDNVDITGYIGSGSIKNNSIKVDNNVKMDRIDKIYLPKEDSKLMNYNGNFDSDIEKGKIVIREQSLPKLELPSFPEFDYVSSDIESIDHQDGEIHPINLNSDIEYDKIELEDNSTLQINVGNENRIITLNDLEMQNGHITFTGSGRVTLHINKQVSLEDNSTINLSGGINLLNIYVKDHFKITGESIVKGSVYVSKGHIKLKDSELYGNVFIEKKKIDVEDSSKIHSEIIYAPNSDVTVDDSTIEGPIISDSFDMQGGFLDHQPPFTLTGPLSFGALDFEWPDLGQGYFENENENGDSTKPEGGPTIIAPPIIEVQ